MLLDQNAYNLASDELIGAVKQIEQLGYESVWLLDSFSRDPFITASFILSKTDKIAVGTGIATVYSRDAMAAVQARETLSEYYPGRFLMGLGASNETIVKMRGGAWMPPVKKMSAYLEAMVTTELAHPRPRALAPIYLAAHAPGLQNLAIKHASGIITWILPVDSVRVARSHIGNDLEITANFPCVVNANENEARKIAREFLSSYLQLDYYRSAYTAIGFAADDFENGGSDRLIDAIVAWGDPPKIKQRVDEYEVAGATRVVLNPIRGAAGDVPGREWNAESDLESLIKLAPLLL
ncbi:LLM class flavin-dependent oxidoreductase [Paraburkholderia rhynchosiae]|uniref:LLM class flavin-dependent oxidoreductase n=1 Tax=Paraburkholderia rhynchosiae TaxID=487049 RepID=UPI0013049512|nr:LLM class flavin-dependent oxidoreductase [Paraburkholderia rhynchosiae]